MLEDYQQYKYKKCISIYNYTYELVIEKNSENFTVFIITDYFNTDLKEVF